MFAKSAVRVGIVSLFETISRVWEMGNHNEFTALLYFNQKICYRNFIVQHV